MKKILFVLLAILIAIGNAKSQTTYNPSVKSRNNYCDIESVTLTNQYTIVRIRVPKSHYKSASINSATVLVPIGEWPIEYARQSNLDLTDFPGFSNDSYINSMLMKTIENNKENRKQLSDLGYLIRGLGDDKLDTNYKPAKGAESFVFTLYFDRLSEGIDEFYIREITKTGWEWYGVKINNPRPASLITSYNANSIKTKIDSQSDGIVGIYEGTTTNENRYTLGCIKDNGIYKLIYLDCRQNTPQWQVGEVKCVLTPTATNGFFKGDWYMANKSKNDNCYITFTGATMSVLLDGRKEEYIKMYPTSTGNGIMTEPIEWSGSGFALNNGYFVTNYHVVEDAKSIIIKGIKGNFENAYNAEVVATDKYNDLALLKINDSRFTGFGTIPYKVKTSTSDVGEEIFVLGFPLTSTMGDEIKLTTGVISSKTGFQGDVSLYQISAPVQPGNSGGPLFDSRGNLIGIVSSKHTGAENVGYAIKASYLKNLVESAVSSSIIPSNNTISSQPLTSKVKSVQGFVFMIECSK